MNTNNGNDPYDTIKGIAIVVGMLGLCLFFVILGYLAIFCPSCF